MTQSTQEFIETIKNLLAKKTSVPTSNIEYWKVYGFHYDRLGDSCPVCGKTKTGWMITYVKEEKERCCICHRCSSLMPQKYADELMKSYISLRNNIDALLTDHALDYCLRGGYIDHSANMVYNNLQNKNYGNVLYGNAKMLVVAVNYQFLKLLKDRQPSSNKALHRD